MYWYYHDPGFGAGESMASLVPSRGGRSTNAMQRACVHMWQSTYLMHYVGYNLIKDDMYLSNFVYIARVWKRKKKVSLYLIQCPESVPGGCGGTEVTEADRADAQDITLSEIDADLYEAEADFWSSYSLISG